MSATAVRRRGLGWFAMGMALGMALVVFVGLLLLGVITVNLDPLGFGGGIAALPSPTSPPSSTQALIPMKPGTIEMPANANCAACHLTTGGLIGTKPIPVIAHPLDGWRQCTACHTNDSLVKTAPGHSGIHATECLVCHTQSSQPAPTRAHPSVTGLACLSCHGVTAPLPHDMKTRSETECWICHRSQ